MVAVRRYPRCSPCSLALPTQFRQLSFDRKPASECLEPCVIVDDAAAPSSPWCWYTGPSSPLLCAACEHADLLMSDHAPGCGRCASRPDPRNACSNFFPRCCAASSRDKQVAFSRPALRCGPYGCGSAVPGLRIAIKAAMVAGLKQKTEIIMAQIGTFTRGEDGVFAGTIKTLSLNVKARLVPADESTNDKAPDLRVLVGNVEIGAAWHRTSKENTEYHSVKLDDPSFPAPIYANLFKGETDYTLVWSR